MKKSKAFRFRTGEFYGILVPIFEIIMDAAAWAVFRTCPLRRSRSYAESVERNAAQAAPAIGQFEENACFNQESPSRNRRFCRKATDSAVHP